MRKINKRMYVATVVIVILFVIRLIMYWLSLGDKVELYGWYYIDTKGHVVNDQPYYYADGDYNKEGIVFVNHIGFDTTSGKIERTAGFIDTEGNLIGNKTFKESDIHTSPGEIEFPVIFVKSGMLVLLDEHLRQVAELEETFGSKTFGYLDFAEGLGEVCVVIDGEDIWGYINENAEWVIPPQFKSTREFTADGIARVTEYETGKEGYITRDGRWISDERYYAGKNFYGGYTLVQREENGPAAYINSNGQNITGFDYDFMYSSSGFSEGVAKVKPYDGDRYYLINEKGEKLFDRDFSYCGTFLNGLCLVGNDKSKYGYIDINGNVIIDYKYDSASSFSDDGYAVVEINGKCGIIDKNGKWLYKPQFSEATTIINGYARVKLDDDQRIRKRAYSTYGLYVQTLLIVMLVIMFLVWRKQRKQRKQFNDNNDLSTNDECHVI